MECTPLDSKPERLTILMWGIISPTHSLKLIGIIFVKLKTTILLLATAIMVGCSSSDDDADGSDQTSMPAPDTGTNGTPQALSRFIGNYVRGCTIDDFDNDTWDIIELSIQEGGNTSTITEFSDSECTQPTLTFTFETSFSFPGGTANTALGVADFLDVTIESAALNGVDAPDTQDQEFDLILLDGNNLHFGLLTFELNGNTAETRPVEIDQSEMLVRL